MSGWRHALSWFPGHAAKASRDMAERLRHVDIVLEIRDARAPRTSASSHLGKLVRGAARADRRLLVINKADLISTSQRDDIRQWMDEDHPGVPCFFTSAAQQRGRDGGGGRSAPVGVRELLDAAVAQMRETAPRLFRPAPRDGGDDVARQGASPVARAISHAAAAHAGLHAESVGQSLPLIMMIVGVPNVGKSSLINAFRLLSTSAHAAARGGAAPPPAAAARRGGRSRKPAKTGALPGVTTALSGFQVSWEPTVWMLDTPGVLTPRIEGGWESALRLGVLDLIKYDHDALEGLGAYALLHLATTDARRLSRWPRARALAAAGPTERHDPRQTILGFGPDPFAAAAGDGAACASERFALSLLAAAAADMNLTTRVGGGRRDERPSVVPDTASAAGRVLALVRRGELGPLCFDAHPPRLDEDRRRRGRAARERVDRAPGRTAGARM